ncbi:MAG: hypothetical protein ACFCU8_13055 [Thermosynechococcaceae cyanobacterium]
MLDRIVNTQANQLETLQNQEARLQKLEDGQLAIQELGGILARETRQLKRAMDYLLSKDGEKA